MPRGGAIKCGNREVLNCRVENSFGILERKPETTGIGRHLPVKNGDGSIRRIGRPSMAYCREEPPLNALRISPQKLSPERFSYSMGKALIASHPFLALPALAGVSAVLDEVPFCPSSLLVTVFLRAIAPPISQPSHVAQPVHFLTGSSELRDSVNDKPSLETVRRLYGFYPQCMNKGQPGKSGLLS